MVRKFIIHSDCATSVFSRAKLHVVDRGRHKPGIGGWIKQLLISSGSYTTVISMPGANTAASLNAASTCKIRKVFADIMRDSRSALT